MMGFKRVVFIFIATTLSGMGFASQEPASKLPPLTASPSAKIKPAETITPTTLPSSRLAEETKLTAEALEAAGDEKLVDPMVPEGARLVDGTEKDEFYIVPKNGAIPKVETAQTKAVTDGMKEAEEMVSKINVPKLQEALGEKAHEVGTTKQASKAIATARNGALTPKFAENNVKMPSIQLVEADVTPTAAASEEQKPADATASSQEADSKPETAEPVEKKDSSEIKKQTHHNSKELHKHKVKAHTKNRHAAKHHEVNHYQVKSMSSLLSSGNPKSKPANKSITAKQYSKTHAPLKAKKMAVSTKHHQAKKSPTVAYHNKVFKVKRFEDIR